MEKSKKISACVLILALAGLFVWRYYAKQAKIDMRVDVASAIVEDEVDPVLGGKTGKKVLKVEYKWTNNDVEKTFSSTYNVTITQDGKPLQKVSFPLQTADNKNVKKNETASVEIKYFLNNTTSDVKIVLTKTSDNDAVCLDKTIHIK